MTFGAGGGATPRAGGGAPAPVDIDLTDGTARVVVHGDFDATTSVGVVDAVVAALADRELTRVVVDMSGAGFVDSTGLGALVRLRLEAAGLGARTSLVGLDRRLEKLLRLTGLDRDFSPD